MNAERLLEHYERIAFAPDAIAHLRRFILDLAARAKLVPQDPKDEPASILLKRIAKEKARLVKTGEIKVRTMMARDRREPLEFQVPAQWELTDLGSVALKITDGAHKTPTYVKRGIPFVSVKDFSAGKLDLSNTRFIPEAEHHILYQRCDPRRGDILLGRIGTLGKAVLVNTDVEFSLFVSVGMIRFSHANIDPEFFRLILNSPVVEAEFNRIKIGGGTHTNKLNLGDLYTVMFPLPPLAEQHRIVAKVGELMALCDRLEAARVAQEATRDRLATASLARLNVPDSETFYADVRFVLDALPAITARADQIKQLRRTILNLAVCGKLVEQNPADAPVTDANAANAGLTEALPSSWRYVRLEQLLRESTRNGYSRRPDDAENGIPILRISAGTVRQDGVVAEEEHKLISGIDEVTRVQYGLERGDLLACRFNGNKSFVGRLTLYSDYLGLNPIYPDKLIRVRLNRQLALPEFIRMASDANLVRRAIEELCATTVGNWGISASNLREVLFPLPPLAQQHRIVAKVDALMALCDQLEASLTTGEETRRSLLEASLASALDPAAVHELEAA